jgi:hypothetical protein
MIEVLPFGQKCHSSDILSSVPCIRSVWCSWISLCDTNLDHLRQVVATRFLPWGAITFPVVISKHLMRKYLKITQLCCFPSSPPRNFSLCWWHLSESHYCHVCLMAIFHFHHSSILFNWSSSAKKNHPFPPSSKIVYLYQYGFVTIPFTPGIITQFLQ